MSHRCEICGCSADSHHRCTSAGMLGLAQRESDQVDTEVPSDELRLAEGFSILNDEYYS